MHKRVLLGILLATVAATSVMAQNNDNGLSTHEPQPTVEARTVNQPTRAVAAAYSSARLKADLRLEWLYIDTPMGRVTFWGARIVGMRPVSPLRQISGINLGDVITRLDGIRISDRAYQVVDPQSGEVYYMLPEAERHYGETDVRWIASNTSFVREDMMDLGPLNIPPPNPVSPAPPGTQQPMLMP